MPAKKPAREARASRNPSGKDLASATSISSSEPVTRLHVSPFDENLVDFVLPGPLRAQAKNISFHTLETFPERRYGFVDLPTAEAEKIKRKLHGSMVKGEKMKVEKARKEKRRATDEEEDTHKEPKRDKKKRKRHAESEAASGDPGAQIETPGKTQKRGMDGKVQEAVDLRGRKVKRAWTESPAEHKADRQDKKKTKSKGKDKDGEKRRVKSKYTDHEEHLLRIQFPANVPLPNAETTYKKRKKGQKREAVVHEFERTEKLPTFLKGATSTGGSKPPQFVDGKGWVDEDGNVVESMKKSGRYQAEKEEAKAAESSDSSSDSSSSEEESEEEDENMEAVTGKEAKGKAKATPTKSTPLRQTLVDSVPKADASGRPKSSSSAKSLTIKIPPPVTPSSVHPLEALYKKRKATEAENSSAAPTTGASEPFTFFGTEDGEEDDEAESAPGTVVRAAQMPMTPFTQQDFEWRMTRSAAPTPDTAHPSRVSTFWGREDERLDTPMEEDESEDDRSAAAGENDEDEEMEEGDREEAGGDGGDEKKGKTGKSAFQDWFWENRGDLNRSWMKRRKTAGKEKRQRENRARAARK